MLLFPAYDKLRFCNPWSCFAATEAPAKAGVWGWVEFADAASGRRVCSREQENLLDIYNLFILQYTFLRHLLNILGLLSLKSSRVRCLILRGE